jgi:periplasmic protein TonB
MVSAANSDAPSDSPRGAKSPAPEGPRRHSGQRPSAMPQRDGFAFMFAFGRRQMRVGLMIGLAGTLVVHGAAAARGLSTLLDLATFARTVHALVEDRLHATYDLDTTPPPEVKPPEPEPQPEPEQVKPVARSHAEPPPTPAQAAKVMTSEPDPSDAPVDMTGWGIVSGEADRFPGGQTSSKGTSTKPVGQAAAASGVPNATGTAPTPPAPPAGKDLSRVARPAEGNWNCGFPAEADMEQINSEKVLLVVTVSPDGRPTKVSVLSDPGFGFGRVARQCAMRKTYTAGLDRAGNAITTTTPPITVRFIR